MAVELGLFKPAANCPKDSDEWAEDLKEKLATFSSVSRLSSGSADSLQQFLIELVWATLRGQVTLTQVMEFLGKTDIPSREGLQRTFADVLWLVGFVAIEQNKGEMKTEFEHLCVQLEKEQILPRQQFAMALETESVPAAVCSALLLKKKHNQAKTKARYTITRYNLLREHTEGYAKLLVILDRASNLEWNPPATAAQAEETRIAVADEVLRLAGFCHLCPNRILSAVLDLYERRLEAPEPCQLARPLLELLRRFPAKRLSEVAAFQLLSHPPGPPPAGSKPQPQAPPLPAPARPSQFLAVAALVQQELVELEGLWGYLEPSDASLSETYSSLKSKYEEEVAKSSTVDLSSSGAKSDKEEFQKGLQNFNQAGEQKFLLAAALISVNCWDKAHRLLLHLRQFCKPVLNHYIRSALCDLLKWLLNPCLRPTQQRLLTKAKPGLDSSYHGVRRFQLGLEHADASSGDEPGAVPQALRPTAEYEQLMPQVRMVLDHLEYFLHTDQHLLSSLWRVVAQLLRQQLKEKQTADSGIVGLINRHLLPAASLVPHNPHLSELMWNVIGQLNVFQRYMIYSCWETMYDGFLLKLTQEKTRNSAKQILKRVVANAERRDLVAHNSNFHFCKLCHSNPIPALEVMIRDIERGFNVNMIHPYIECTSRCSDMTADVMGYVLARNCNKPASAGRTFLNQEDALVSSWLCNLGEFIGRFFKKHPTTDFHGLLTIITKRINSEAEAEFKGDSLIRVVLENLIEHVGGLLTVADMNDDQLLCLAGGPRLRGESIAFGKKEDSVRKEKARSALVTALVELGLVKVLWYSLSQQRHYFLSEHFSETHSGSSGMKLLGLLFDGNHDCFLKLTEFLVQSCPREKYWSLLPSLQEVFSNFEPSLAFLIIRHGLPQFGMNPSSAAGEKAQIVLNDLERVVRLYLPESFVTDGLSINFYLTFWRLSLQDIFTPNDGYEKVSAQIAASVKGMEASRKKLEHDREHARDCKALKKDIARAAEMQKHLKEEQLQQKLTHDHVWKRLEQEKAQWFVKPSPTATSAFVAQMLCPRVLISYADALFCCRFVKLLIRLKTPGFQLLDFYNSWTIMLTQSIRCCSERETQIFGLFLREMMSYVRHLRVDEKAYNDEMKGNPCFHRNYYEDPNVEGVVYAKFQDFSKGHTKWEGRIYKAVKAGLDSEDWMEKRNALLLLSETYTAFPAVDKYGKQVLACVEAMKEKEEYSDLKTLAGSLVIKLKTVKEKWLDKAPPQPAAEKKTATASTTEEGHASRSSAGRGKNALTDAQGAKKEKPKSTSTPAADSAGAAKPSEPRDRDRGSGSTAAAGAADATRGSERAARREEGHERRGEGGERAKERDAKAADRGETRRGRDAEAREEPREAKRPAKESRSKDRAEKPRGERDREAKPKSTGAGEKESQAAPAREVQAESSRKRAASGAGAGGGAGGIERTVTVHEERPEKRRRTERELEAPSSVRTSVASTGDRHGQQPRNALASEAPAHLHGSSGRPASPHGHRRGGGGTSGGHHASRSGHDRRR